MRSQHKEETKQGTAKYYPILAEITHQSRPTPPKRQILFLNTKTSHENPWTIPLQTHELYFSIKRRNKVLFTMSKRILKTEETNSKVQYSTCHNCDATVQREQLSVNELPD